MITPDDARTTVLKQATEALLAAQPDWAQLASGTEFRFCALPHILGPAGPFREIWQIAGRSGTHALLEGPLERREADEGVRDDA